MRTLLIGAIGLTVLAAAPALAQSAPQGDAKSTAPAVSEPPTHEQCKAVMGHKMDAKRPHDHGQDKSGAATWPNGKPLSQAEMDKLHARCAEKMAKTPAAK